MAISTILILFLSLFSFFYPYFLSLLLSNGALKIDDVQLVEVPANAAKWCAAHLRDHLLKSFIDVKNIRIDMDLEIIRPNPLATYFLQLLRVLRTHLDFQSSTS